MSSQNPRDMREYFRILERQSAQLRGIPALIHNTVTVIKDENKQDKERRPAAPVELSAQTAFYLDTSSRRRVRFVMDFPDVVFHTDGTPATIQQYELWGRDETESALKKTVSAVPAQALPGMTMPGLTATAENVEIAEEEKPWFIQSTNVQSFFRVDGYIPGSVWRFRARALGASTVQPGEWSEEIVVQMLADASPPPQPTAPTVVASRGQLTVTWDGLAVSGAMPPDFSYAILAHGTESSPTFEVARFGRGGGFKVITDIPYYDPQFFRVRAYDESGNGGPWSEQATGYTTPLVDKDLIISKLDAAKTHLKNINAGVSILPNTIITEHLLVTESMTAAIAEFLVVNADQINVNSLFADQIFTGLLDATVVRADMFEGKAFEGGIFTTTKGGRFQTDVEEYRGLKIDATGMLGFSRGGVETLRYDAATGNISIGGGVFTGGKFQSSSFANTGVKLDANGLKIWNTNGQLVMNATPSGAQFTGTVTSGFGSASVTIDDSVYGGRPGVSIGTGQSYYAQPFMISYDSTASTEYLRGSLYASAAWTSGSASPGRLMMGSNGSWSLGGAEGTVATTLGAVQVTAKQGGKMYAGANAYLAAANSAAVVQVDADGEAYLGGQGRYLRLNSSGALLAISSTVGLRLDGSGASVFGGLSVSGSKNFVMPHPTKDGMELLHGSTESPVSGIEYWGAGVTDSKGRAVIELPDYFEALAKPEGRTVLVMGRGAALDWSEIVDGRVTVSGVAGTKFSWLVKAERFGGDFDVERKAMEPLDTNPLVDALASETSTTP